MDREFLRKTLSEFEEVMDSAENAKKKHLLRQLVKKVLVHDRRTIEVWYGLPNSRRFEYCNKKLPGQSSNLRASG